MLSFSFPNHTLRLEEVLSITDLRDKLRLCAQLEDVNSRCVKYKVSRVRSYIYAKCRQKGCPATLNYHQTGETFTLNSSKTDHIHRPYQTKTHMYSAVTEYLESIPKGTSLLQLKHAVCRSFHINERQFYYLLTRLNNQIPQFDQYTNKLQAQGYEIYVSRQQREKQQPPKALVAVSPAMKRAFALYGERVSFDLTFRLIKNRTEEGGTWKVGVFLGLSACNRLAPLGIAIMTESNKDAYADIFRMFFAGVGGVPKVIISDQERAIHAGISGLQESREFEGVHMYDSYHILHNLYKKLGNKADIRYYANMIHAKNEAELAKHISIAQNKLDNRPGTHLDNFLKNKHMYCFASSQCKTFLGFTSSSSINESFHALIKRIQTSEKDYVVAFRNLVDCCQRLLSKCQEFQMETFAYQDVFKVGELKGVRILLTKSIFSQFIAEFAHAVHLNVVEKDEDDVLVVEYSQFFKVSLIDAHWRCGCGYLEKCSLPCRHLLKTLLLKGRPIIEHIPTRWRSTGEQREKKEEKMALGRQRSSKRKAFF